MKVFKHSEEKKKVLWGQELGKDTGILVRDGPQICLWAF